MSGTRKKRCSLWLLGVGLTFALAAFGVGDTSVWPLLDAGGGHAYVDAVTEVLAAARTTVDLLLASLDLDDNPLVEELVRAHERGVRVRLILDESDWSASITQRNRPAVEILAERGIEARFDDPGVTTHAKLVIVDRAIVVLGSTNWNTYALFEHRQANVRIDDERVGEAFAAFFDRQWDAPGGGQVEAAWTSAVPAGEAPTIVALPDADGTALYGEFAIEWLARAKRSIHAVLYRISVYPQYPDGVTSRLVAALRAAAARGLDVRVLIDDCRFYEDSAEANLMSALYLYQNGIDVRFDAPELTTHAKLLVIDGEHTIVGSTNWNYYSVERNVEANVALLFMPDVARAFDGYFERLWREGRSVGP